MKYRNLIASVAIMAFTFLISCDRPKTIKDGDLKAILKDIFLSNAIYSNNRTKIENLDSLDIYSPIFKRYGYKTTDLQYTIDGFSRRKSASFSDVLSQVYNNIDSSYQFYDSRVTMLDSIDAKALELARQVVYTDSLVIVKQLRDTSKLHIKLAAEQGKYEIHYNYTLDSTDKNTRLSMIVKTLDSLGKQISTASKNIHIVNDQKEQISIVSSENADTLQIILANYKKDSKYRPNIRFDSLEVIRYPTIEVAIDSLMKSYIDLKSLESYVTRFTEAKTDSVSLSLHDEGIPAKRDSLPR